MKEWMGGGCGEQELRMIGCYSGRMVSFLYGEILLIGYGITHLRIK